MSAGLFTGYSIAFGLVSIMIAIAGIIIGIGIAIDDRKLKEIGRSELYQAVINGVMVGALFAAFTPGGIITMLMNSMVRQSSQISCTGIEANNYAICFANQFLVGLSAVPIGNQTYPTLMMSTLSILVPSAALYGTISFVASLKISLLVVSISFATMLQPLLSILNYIISTLSLTLASLVIQDMLLKFIAMSALSTLLPVGIILRTFYFTRRLGGAILAIAIALFTVFPLTYLFDAQLIAGYSTSSTAAVNALMQNSTALKNNVTSGFITANGTRSALSQISGGIESFSISAEKLFFSLADSVAMIIIEAFFLPILSIMLTVISARELARILGSEVSFGRFDMF